MKLVFCAIQKIVFLVAVSFTTTYATAEIPNNSISIGYLGAGVESSEVEASVISYERKLNDGLSLSFRFIDLEYEYEDGNIAGPYFEFEEGEGNIIEFAVHLFPTSSGFYYGAGIGVGKTDYNYFENDFGFVTIESDDSIGYEFFGRVGYNFTAGPVFIKPHVQLGRWFEIGESVDIYGALGLELGLSF